MQEPRCVEWTTDDSTLFLVSNVLGTMKSDKAKVSQKDLKSFANGTNDREAHPKFWIAALVKMNYERKAEVKLNKLGFETYLPIQKEERQWSDRKKIIDRIVIPMVIFIKISPKEDEIIRNYSFIRKLLTLPGAKGISSPIPDEQIEDLRYLLDKAESEVSFISDITDMKIGDKVQIIRGTLKGLIGELRLIDRMFPKIVIRIDGLGYASVSVSLSFVEKII